MTTSRKEGQAGGGKLAEEKKSLGVYVHLPFCRRKCFYCDFVSFGEDNRPPGLDPARYGQALLEEAASRARELGEGYEVDTLYLGGGTPTSVGVELLAGWIGELTRLFLAKAGSGEVTVEANPESVDATMAEALAAAGVNRVSLGVQSLDDRCLAALGRIHDARQAAAAFDLLRRTVTDNLNVDLMFALPGQSLAAWEKDLKEVLAWRPAHLSFYSLQLEEGTPFYQRYRAGELDLPLPEEERSMYHRALELLDQAGYQHYEVSAAALPGFRSRHNLKYWSMEDYLGLGLAAHSFLGGVRVENTDCAGDYLAGRWIKEALEACPGERMGDYLFTTLRRREGFELQDATRRFGPSFQGRYAAALADLKAQGLLEGEGGQLALSLAGLDRFNDVMAYLLKQGR